MAIVGRVQGKKIKPLNGEKYTYLVIAIREIYLHREERLGPSYYRRPTELYPYRGAYGGF